MRHSGKMKHQHREKVFAFGALCLSYTLARISFDIIYLCETLSQHFLSYLAAVKVSKHQCTRNYLFAYPSRLPFYLSVRIYSVGSSAMASFTCLLRAFQTQNPANRPQDTVCCAESTMHVQYINYTIRNHFNRKTLKLWR